jgi:hypothetical protein
MLLELRNFCVLCLGETRNATVLLETSPKRLVSPRARTEDRERARDMAVVLSWSVRIVVLVVLADFLLKAAI